MQFQHLGVGSGKIISSRPTGIHRETSSQKENGNFEFRKFSLHFFSYFISMSMFILFLLLLALSLICSFSTFFMVEVQIIMIVILYSFLILVLWTLNSL
jgi:uncharacterized membrane protein